MQTIDRNGRLKVEITSTVEEISVGTTTVSGGVSGRVLCDNGGVLGQILGNSLQYIAGDGSLQTLPTSINSVTGLAPISSTGGSNPVISISKATTSTNGYLSSTDWNTFNNKQPAGSYITALSGEATATGPGTASVTLNNASVTGKVLSGLSVSGGSISSSDSILSAFGKLQNQINGLLGSAIYQGTWNASTNTPTLTSGAGTRGYYYIVNVAGSTNLDGITDWKVGDWAIFDGTAWQKVDNTDAVTSVNGQTGAVSLTTDNIPEGVSNLYFTQLKARQSLSSSATGLTYTDTTGVFSLTSGYSIPTTANQADWTTAYNNSIVSASVNYGLSSTSLVFNQQDGGTISLGLIGGAATINDFVFFNGLNLGYAQLGATSPLSFNATTKIFSISQASGSTNGFLSSTDWNTFNGKQNALTLTTTGTSGPATLVGSTLNIPQYSGGGGGASIIDVPAQTLLAASWVFSGGYYVYSFSNVNITTNSRVDFTPFNSAYTEVTTCGMLPYVEVAPGVATFYSLFPPQSDIEGDITIFPTV